MDAETTAAALRAALGIDHVDLALVLGSGWSEGAEAVGTTLARTPLGQVPGLAQPVVRGHGGDVLAVRTQTDRTALVFTGRTHFYEHRDVEAVTHVVRTVAALGARTLVLTNGSGSVHPDWQPGTPVVIRDHINLTGDTPLRGAQFIDMSDAYSARLRELVSRVRPGIRQGVYVQFGGPQYETPAEVEYARRIGGDLVGMSTALETIAARAVGLEVLGLSLVSNPAAGVTQAHLDHGDVLATGRAAAPELRALLHDVIAVLD